MRRLVMLLVAVVLPAAVLAGCGDDGPDESTGGPGTIRVPSDRETIQEAVEAASPGDLVLIEPGTYHEEVDVTTEDLTIRGLDRNEVVLDGEGELENGIRVLETSDSVIENLTVEGYTGNGIFWTGVTGYRGSYLTSLRNGEYGMYAYGSVDGVVEHSYLAGSSDAGLYIGQCGDCRATVDDVTAEWNGFGYSGANSSNVRITDSTWRQNRSGIVMTATSYEGCAPPSGNVVRDNLVTDNGNVEAPANEAAADVSGFGIGLAGAQDVVVEDNEITGNSVAGVAVIPRPEPNPIGPVVDAADPDCIEAPVASDEDLPEVGVWFSDGNRVSRNTVSGSRWDLALVEASTHDNCFEDNQATTSTPDALLTTAPCGPATEAGLESTTFLAAIGVAPVLAVEDADLPDPGPQEGMPDPETT